MSFRNWATAYFHYLTGSGPHRCWDWPALALLSGASWLYRKGVLAKYHSIASHPERQEHVPAVVISLGNITVGGTGKTPTACMLARRLQAQGWRVALLNRGYRSQREQGGAAVMSDGQHVLLTAEEGGDEACLMARSLPGVPVLVGRHRAAGGRLAVERFGTQVLLLDDGVPALASCTGTWTSSSSTGPIRSATATSCRGESCGNRWNSWHGPAPSSLRKGTRFPRTGRMPLSVSYGSTTGKRRWPWPSTSRRAACPLPPGTKAGAMAPESYGPTGSRSWPYRLGQSGLL